MYHSFEDGGVKDIVLKACMSDPWSKDGWVLAYVSPDDGTGGGAPVGQDMDGIGVPADQGIGEAAP